MALSLRYVKPNLLNIVTRHCRPYSTQIDGLRLNENALDLNPREELTHYQDLVTDKVSAILEEGKRLAHSVCAKSGSNSKTAESTRLKDLEDFDIASLLNEAHELHTRIASNNVVPHFHFYNAKPEVKTTDNLTAAAVSMQHKRLIQSYSYSGDNNSHNNSNVNDLLRSGKVLDHTFNVDTIQTLPPHLLAYVRENTLRVTPESLKANGINLQELFKLELQSCQHQISENKVWYSTEKSDVTETERTSPDQSSSQIDDDERPSKDQLMKVHEIMTKELPRILLSKHDYRMYRPEVVFENNFFDAPRVTKGIAQYVVQIARLRIWAHLKFANVKMVLLKSSIEEDEGSITFHWRMSGVPQIRAFMFWKFLPWTYKDTVRKESDYHEGISTFHVDNTGLIAKHKLDKMMLDKEYETAAPRKNLRHKLNKLLSPKPAMGAACKSNDK